MADRSVTGQVYRDGGLQAATLWIDTKTGRIEKVADPGDTVGEHTDFGDHAILPGAIDIHVHFRDPGHPHKEDWYTGTVAAAFGGVTGVVDMPNTVPATTTPKALREKLRTASQKAVVDHAAWCGTTWFTGDLPEMLQWSPGLKLYLGASTGDLLSDDLEVVERAIRATTDAGRTVVLHAEAQRVLDRLKRTEDGLQDHDTTRPPMAEVEAIYDVMKMLPRIKGDPRIHIAHAASVDAVQAASKAGFSVGVCPHHLLLDVEGCCSSDPGYGKMNPPLRDPAARRGLWDAFAAGMVPILESDHAPHTAREKHDAFQKTPSGVPGVETMMPLLLRKSQAGDVSLAVVVDALTRAPAELLGLADRGVLEAGRRADFAVYDLQQIDTVEAARLHSKCGWTPFEGHEAIFPHHTFLAGRAVVEAGTLKVAPGSGRPLWPLPEDP